MATMQELDYSERKIQETPLQGMQDLDSRDVLSQFERYWFSGLGLIPNGWLPSLRPEDQEFENLVMQRFHPAFFQIDGSYTVNSIAWAVLQAFPERVPQNIFAEGSKSITEFCLDVVPVVERAYPDAKEEYPEFLAHRIIEASIGAYSIVLDHFGQKPLTNGARINLQLEIGKALRDKEIQQTDGVVYLTKKPIELGVNPRYTP